MICLYFVFSSLISEKIFELGFKLPISKFKEDVHLSKIWSVCLDVKKTVPFVVRNI